MPGVWKRLGVKVARGYGAIGKKVSSANRLYNKYGSKVASIINLVTGGKYKGQIEKAQGAIRGAQTAGQVFKMGDHIGAAEALRGAAKTAGASQKVLGQASNAIEKSKKARSVYKTIRGPD